MRLIKHNLARCKTLEELIRTGYFCATTPRSDDRREASRRARGSSPCAAMYNGMLRIIILGDIAEEFQNGATMKFPPYLRNGLF